MNCDDYLAMLATLPADELDHGHVRGHAETCRDCARVTRVVMERDRNMALQMADAQSLTPADASATFLATSRRRRVALFYRIGLGAAALVTITFMVTSTFFPQPLPQDFLSETRRLKCLSPAQAARIARAKLSSSTARIAMRSNDPTGMITLGGTRAEVAAAMAMLDHLDNAEASTCTVPSRTTTTTH